jgi:rfaE bifunctional protein nucleotidyltransferase chain/domain
MAEKKAFRAVALLDRDGTIIEEREYLSDPEGVQLVPGAAHAIRILNQEGVAAVLTTNQSGIPRGFFTEETLRRIHDRMNEVLAAEGVHLDGIYFAPSLPDSGDSRRKPGVGMYQEAARDLGLEGLPVYAIGDRSLDVEFGVACGGKGIRVLTGHQLKEDMPNKLEAMQRDRQRGLVFTAENLLHAVHILLADILQESIPEDRLLKAKFGDLYNIARAIREEHSRDNRVVLTNGCFDLIHGGHVSYLEGAREMGDKLVVAINSDASMRRIKGKERPIMKEAERVQVLANLRCVDYITIFHDDTADHLLEVLRPDVHAKGTDYRADNVPEGGTAKRLGFKTAIAGAPKENSTKDIIQIVVERAKQGLL